MEARDCFIRLADPTGKHKDVINHHRVWDAERFIEAQHRQYSTEAKPGETRIVIPATKSDYDHHHEMQQ